MSDPRIVPIRVGGYSPFGGFLIYTNQENRSQ